MGMNEPRFVLATLVLVLAVAGPAGAQGLGDAARKEKSRRTDTKPKEPATVYTNDTILPTGDGQPSKGTFSSPAGNSPAASSAVTPPASPALPRSGSAVAAPEAGAASSAAQPEERGESYWRSRLQQAQAAIAAADRRLRDLEAQASREALMPDKHPMDCSTTRLPGETFMAWRDRSAALAKKCAGSSFADAAGQLEGARQEAAAARKALDDVQEEARRAGALPGWLR
jgi:hypothetical protein